MRLIKLALVLTGVAFGIAAHAEGVADDTAFSDEAYLLFNGTEDANTMATAESPDSARMYVRCQSRGFRMNYCRVPGRIISATLVRRLSFAPCVANRTFGVTNRFLWVRQGCSGDFLVRYRDWGHGGGHGGGGWDHDQDQDQDHGGGHGGGHGGHHGGHDRP